MTQRPQNSQLRFRLATVLSLAAALAIATGSGCARVVKTDVSDREGVKVYLRSTAEAMGQVDRGYQHPTNIAPQRLAHILGAVEVEIQGGTSRARQAALHPEILLPIARGLVEGFEQATPSQQVAVMAVRKEQRLGLFHKKYLTSLLAFFRDDRLYLQFSRIEWEIPKNREDGKLPEPQPNEKQMAFRTIPALKMKPMGAQGVVVQWRDNLFASPVRSASSIGGDFNKRTLLMESPLPEAETDEGIDAVNLDAETLRAIADLKEARRSGEISEAEYRDRLENLLR